MRNGGLQHGNTVSEYGILFGFLTLAAIGALSLLGGNISTLLSSLQGPVSAKPGIALSLAQLSQPSGTNMPGTIEASAQPTLPNSNVAPNALMTENSSGGMNATSVDGNQQTGIDTVHTTWGFAQRLSQLASETSDSKLKNYFTVLANDAYWLSGAQANYEYHAEGNEALKSLGSVLDNGDINMDTTLSTIKGWNNTLKMDFERLQADTTIPQSVKQEALALAQRVMNQNEQRYAAYYRINESDTRLNTTDTFDQLKAIAKQTLASGQADLASSVKTSIQTATRLDEEGTVP